MHLLLFLELTSAKGSCGFSPIIWRSAYVTCRLSCANLLHFDVLRNNHWSKFDMILLGWLSSKFSPVTLPYVQDDRNGC
jgi:hypothetical protein